VHSVCSSRRVESLYSPYGPSWPVKGWTLPLPLPLPLHQQMNIEVVYNQYENCSEIYRCSDTILREFTVVSAKIMRYWRDNGVLSFITSVIGNFRWQTVSSPWRWCQNTETCRNKCNIEFMLLPCAFVSTLIKTNHKDRVANVAFCITFLFVQQRVTVFQTVQNFSFSGTWNFTVIFWMDLKNWRMWNPLNI
jgi:hypothetical protein